MVTEPNINTLKDRIIFNLKQNTSIYNEANPEDVFRDIRFGKPVNNSLVGLHYPIMFVTNADGDFETDKPWGPQSGGAITGSVHRFVFQIIMLNKGSDPEDVERKLGTLYKAVKEQLKSYHDLRLATDGSDALAITSWAGTARHVSLELRGQPIDGLTIPLIVEVGSN